MGGDGGTGLTQQVSFGMPPSMVRTSNMLKTAVAQSKLKKNIFPEPNIEDWTQYCKSLIRNRLSELQEVKDLTK